MNRVRAGLRDDVNESSGASSELSRCAIRHHLKLLDGVQAHREGRTLAAALFAEEGVVVIRPVDGHIVVDALLSIDGDLVAVGSLHDGDAGGQRNQTQKIPSVVRKVAN